MDLLIQKIAEQLLLVSISILLSIGIGIPLGIVARFFRRFQGIILGIAGIMQTIPSLALLAALLPLFGIGMTPAIIALTIYALLPILSNTIAAFKQIPHETIEAARGLGANTWQCLWKIELPQATPLIIAGIRTAVAMTVGIATIAAFIGAGGLGDFITRGLAMNNYHLLLMGAIPAGGLALLLDGVFAYCQHKPKHTWGILLILALLLGLQLLYTHHQAFAIRVGTKNFTEQYILGELISQLIENKTHLKVERKFNLGTTEICQKAMEKREIDIYPEYSGTAYMTVLHQSLPLAPLPLFNAVKQTYAAHYHIIWLPPLGFNNAQSLTVRQDFAEKYHLRTFSDLVPLGPQLIIGAPPEFLDRSDSYPALQKAYGIHFKEIKGMDPGLLYQAIHRHEVDVINAFTTDGRIPVYHLHVLQDDKLAFPAYEASVLIRETVLKTHPELNTLLNQLSGQITTEDMQKLNKAVDMGKLSPAQAAHGFLVKKHLL